MAFDPPPTHATTASGSLPVCATYCALSSSPDDALELGDQGGEGVRSGGGAHTIVRGTHVGDPVAHGFVHRVLQGTRAGLDRDDARAEHAHARDVGAAPHVDRTHVHLAREAHDGARGRGRDTVLPGAGLGDDPCLAELLREQHLAERVVDLVSARVTEILALEGRTELLPWDRCSRERERRRPAHVFGSQPRHSLWNAGVLTISSSARPSSSSAGTRVSATNRPPNLPNQPSAHAAAASTNARTRS